MRKALLGFLSVVFVLSGATVVGTRLHHDDAAASQDPVPTSQEPATSPSLPTPPASTTSAPSTPSTPSPADPSSSAPAEPSTPPSAPVPDCTPTTPLVDPEATPEARCLAATLDRWQADGSYGAGQELNVSSQNYRRPLTDLDPLRPAVVGFDLEELGLGQTYGFSTPPLDTLLQLAGQGTVLTASWHMTNPDTGGDAFDRSWMDLPALVADRGHPAHVFWKDFDAKLALLRELQTGDGGRYAPAAVVFRPMHEANGDWFWWAQGNPASAYRDLYAAMQTRAAAAGVHNVVWAWSFNVLGSGSVVDASDLLPDKVDLVGIDSYESMVGRSTPDQQLSLSGLSSFAGSAPRIAVTEAGPLGSTDGNWDPRSVAAAARAQGLHPAYVMMWFDDGDGSDGSSGEKQISSLQQGPSWLRSCPDGVCSLDGD